ncbi:MAG: hypothetical protein H5T66_03970 [Chloroflexi bacterium]|nr:hypothetical protein [Chloroflexota bacterium]
MPNATWTVSQYLFLGAGLALFALLGFWQGANRQLFLLVGAGLGFLLVRSSQGGLMEFINRSYRILQIAFGGGDLLAACQAAQQSPDLVRTSTQIKVASLIVMFAIVLVFYLIGQRRIAGPRNIVFRALGALIGAFIGYLVMLYMVPIIFPARETLVSLPSGEVQTILSNAKTLGRVFILFIFVLLLVGLFSASGAKGQGSKGGASGTP